MNGVYVNPKVAKLLRGVYLEHSMIVKQGL